MRKQLIKLGSEQPELRPSLRPILAALSYDSRSFEFDLQLNPGDALQELSAFLDEIDTYPKDRAAKDLRRALKPLRQMTPEYHGEAEYRLGQELLARIESLDWSRDLFGELRSLVAAGNPREFTVKVVDNLVAMMDPQERAAAKAYLNQPKVRKLWKEDVNSIRSAGGIALLDPFFRTFLECWKRGHDVSTCWDQSLRGFNELPLVSSVIRPPYKVTHTRETMAPLIKAYKQHKPSEKDLHAILVDIPEDWNERKPWRPFPKLPSGSKSAIYDAAWEACFLALLDTLGA